MNGIKHILVGLAVMLNQLPVSVAGATQHPNWDLLLRANDVQEIRLPMDVQAMASDALHALPDGADVTSKDFDATFSEDTNKWLRTADVREIQRSGSRLDVYQAKAFYLHLNPVEIRLGPTASGDVIYTKGRVEGHNIHGIAAYISPLLGWMDVTDLVVQTNPDGTEQLTAWVKVWISPNKVNYVVRLIHDQQP